MTILLALAAMALLAGLFYGLGTPARCELGPPPALPSAEGLPGGDPADPIRVGSPAVIERHAERWPCPVCGAAVRCHQHRAEQLGPRRLRVARVRCPQCGFERDLYFALTGDPAPRN